MNERIAMKKAKKVSKKKKLTSKTKKTKPPKSKPKISKKQPKTALKHRHKLSIAQMHWGYPPIIGGVETHLAMMLPVMAKMGHSVHLLTGSMDGQKTNYVDRGVKITRTPLMDLNWLFKRGLVGITDEVTSIYEAFIKKSKPDIMHVHNMHYFSKPHAEALQKVCKKHGIPVILTAHNVWDDVLYLELTRSIVWDHIIAVSHYIRRELIGAGCDDTQVTTLHHGVDTKAFKAKADTRETYKKYPKLKGRQIIFHPARMGMAKGCDVSIKALNIIKKSFPDVLMVLAGTKNIIDWGTTQQKDIAYFVNLIKHFKLENNVLVDSFSIDQMPGLYAASNMIIYPSTAMEPFGLTMLEAMATSKPIVVTKAGGMPEIISDGINGFVIPLKDFDELAGVSCRLLGDPGLAKRLGNTGKQMVEAYYTKEHVTRNT
ncbi:MAG: glycosyltransferase family 4 protein, partial [Deltaproteobacteria bacterium]|nr:glycosyltransferase family 4 protein [Deltaproteobacteria bacterium]